MKKSKAFLLASVFICTSVLSCSGFTDSTPESDTVTQGLYKYDPETKTETYEEITYDRNTHKGYVSYSSESGYVKSVKAREPDFDESSIADEYNENNWDRSICE